ncbi:type VII secretion target [Microbacterium sp. W1N]|uniref:type VII secretion target n=1 Tax=Microbacterium festucae TaxID=2977531 RepID=UPI0021BF7F57|nr:type VII secretion target [Microbacterium festucae]MCT9819537.1 type VII secretion target [Microbacterium festucae]
MSADDLEIRSGGIVAVDTDELRRAAGRLQAAAGEARGLGRRVDRALDALPPSGFAVLPVLSQCRRAGEAAAETAERIAADLRTLADVYEYVELGAAAAAAALAGDPGAAAELRARQDALRAASPAVAHLAAAARRDWWARQDDGLTTLAQRLGLLAGVPPPAAAALAGLSAGLVTVVGRGTVPRGQAMGGVAPAVTVTPLQPPVVAAAPATLAEAVRRVPMGTQARVRVEEYTMPDGSRQFVAYVTGTKDDAPGEAFDMEANLQAYLQREQTASIAAVGRALDQSGAAPGDRVHLVGYSQGAMIATHVAMDSPYDVATLVTVGSPVQGEVGDHTLSVALRHSDDPVSALAGGGFATGSGAPGSFVAERTALRDPVPVTQWTMGAHDLGRYAQTATLLDGSADPRMDGVRGALGALAGAASVTAVEYAVTDEPAVADGPR